ncbi:AMP-binding protein, partial [Sinomicrobium oceani]|uniref:AMP-binding protein n=1 Tax=Sinomicrobium oceani TaxID=1150368 RepID=UPI00227B4F29
VVNYTNNVSEKILVDVKNIDFSTNLAFDLTVTTTICSLLLAKTIFIYSGELSDTEQYVRHLIKNKIDFIKSTPSLLANLQLSYFDDHKIRQAFVGGEKLDDFQLAYISKYIDTLIDEYGPTEATVGTSYAQKNIVDNYKGIGKPSFNYKTYVLDTNGFPVPIGVAGELHIAG